MNAEELGVAAWRGLIHLYETGAQRRPTFRHWRELEASQWWAPDRLRELQVERLRALLRHARDTSPWYRSTWAEAGLEPDAVESVDDLRRWPMIDRGTIRANRTAMQSTTHRDALIHKATGGSSGTPLEFDLDRASNDRRMGAWHRGYSWAGAGPGTRQWYLWGVPASSTPGWRKRKLRLYDKLYRRTTANCFELSEARLDDFVRSLARTRPHVIVAYTNALYAFARMLEERAIVPATPHSIVVGAEQLHQFQRDTIERVFAAPVFETYGSREFMLIAAECPEHDGLHLNSEHHVVEIVDEAGVPVPDGVEGDVLVTDLTNYGMPFIRYANGDRAIAQAGGCACGRSLPRLARVTGRRLDVLTTPDGRRLPGEFFPHIIKDLSSVRQFQVVQEIPEAVTIRLVAPTWNDRDEAWLRREIAAAAGPLLEVRLERVEQIPLTGAGKLQVVVNRVSQPAGAAA